MLQNAHGCGHWSDWSQAPKNCKHFLLWLLLWSLSGTSASSAIAGQHIASDADHMDACGVDCKSSFLPQNFLHCLGINFMGTDQLVLPSDLEYVNASQTFNSRIQQYPAAIVYASTTADVAAAVSCATRYGVRVSPACGRQGFQGAAVPDGYLVVDVSNLDAFEVREDEELVTVGAGMSNGMVASAMHATGIPGAALPTGYCTFVGMSGWTLGGGFGFLGRHLGLGCDSVVELEVVLADGSVVLANKDTRSDLFWASCGGGGGTFGIVTKFTFKLHILPNKGRLTSIKLIYTPGVDTSTQAWLQFQEQLPAMSRKYGWVFEMNKELSLLGLYLGPLEEALLGLEEMQMLQGLDQDVPSTITVCASSAPSSCRPSNLTAAFPTGIEAHELSSYYDFVVRHAHVWIGPFQDVAVPWGRSPFTYTPETIAFVAEKLSGRGEERVVGGPGYNNYFSSQSRMSKALSKEGVEAMMGYVAKLAALCAQANESLVNINNIACLTYVTGHVLDGAYADRSPSETAFPHRDMLFILDSTPTFTTTALGELIADDPDHALHLMKEMDILSSDFLRIMRPHTGDAAYVNYQLPAYANWRKGYFGDNYRRLQEVKSTVDPLGIFSKPYTVEGAA